jgi:GT2 family glycosyltransferase
MKQRRYTRAFSERYMKQYPRVSVVTPIFNGIDHTREYLQSMLLVTYPNVEIIIVDDGSTDDSSEVIAREFPSVRLLKGDGNLWWSGGTNLGIRDALERGTDFILTMNNDVKVAPDFLDSLVQCALENPGAIVGGKIYSMDEPQRIWSAGGRLNWWSGKTFELLGHGQMDSDEYCHRARVDVLTGMNVLIPAAVFGIIGFYDANKFPQYHADAEFTLRARKVSIPIIFEPSAKVWNSVESTFMQRFLGSRRYNLEAKWELLTSFKSPMKLSNYWLLHWRYCPLFLIPWAFSLRLGRVLVFLLKIQWAVWRGEKELKRIGV